MPSFVIAFLIFLLPLIFFKIGTFQFEPLKVIIAETLIDILLIYRLTQKKPFHFNLQKIIIFLLLGLTLTDLIFLHQRPTFFGNAFRLQGIFLLWHLLVFAFLSSDIKFPKQWPIFNLVGIFGLLVLAITNGFNISGRLSGSLGEPNALAAVAVFLWPWIYFYGINLGIKILAIAASWIVIILTVSRGGILGVLTQLLFLFLHKIFKLNLTQCLVITLAMVFISLSFPIGIGGGQYQNRSEVWRVSLLSGIDRPVLGYGFGNVEVAIAQKAKDINSTVQYQYVDSSHNILLDIWVEGGIVGLSLFLGLIFVTLQGFTKQKKTLEIALFLGIFETMLFNPVSVVTLIQFWWLIGQSFE